VIGGFTECDRKRQPLSGNTARKIKMERSLPTEGIGLNYLGLR
jgi:hypothetical protein